MLSQTKTVQNVNINDYTECDSVHEQISDFIPPTSICNYKEDDRLSECVFRQNNECLQAKVDSDVYSNWLIIWLKILHIVVPTDVVL